MRAVLVAVALLVAAAAVAPAAAQTCGNIDALARGRGITGAGGAGDASALQRMDSDSNIGLIYLPPGTYNIASSLTLRKPIFGESGAILLVQPGVTLTLLTQPEHPRVQLFRLRGTGKVIFGADTIRVLPEWFGAQGDGRADDAFAVQSAFNAIAESGAAMLYLTASYGIGTELRFTNQATVMSEPSARFVSVRGNARGVTFNKGGFAYKTVMPHMSGFSDFCFRLAGSDLGAFQLQTLANCGDAIRLEAKPEPPGIQNADENTVLDNTVWFDTITNSRIGIAYRALPGCIREACIYQGNQVLGNAINGCAATGITAAIGFFSANPPPAWDANQFNLGAVTPCKNNRQYNLLYVNPESETQREVLKVGSLGAVAPGAQLFSGRHVVLQASLGLREQQPDGAGRLRGLATLVEFTGQTTPPPNSPPTRAANRPNSKASFNGGRSMLGNYFTIQAVPTADWPAGETQKYYVYHQMATGELYQIKCDAPRQKAPSGLPIVACTEAKDNAVLAGGVPGIADEVELSLINLTGQTIKAGTVNVFFNLAVATLGSP